MQMLIDIISLTCHARFPMGLVVITENAQALLKPKAILKALRRFSQCDWGNLCEDDINQNELGLQHGCRLFAAYGKGRSRFWIITDGDRSTTTVLLPADY